MGFQNRVNLQQAPAVAGDFASANPRASVLANEGGLVAGPGGVTVGRFAWISDDGKTVHNYANTPRVPDGFVHRDMQGLIATYLADSSMLIPEGFPITLCAAGDFYAKLAGANAAARNSALFADYSTGQVTAVAAPVGGVVTAVLGSTNTGALGATFTASADTDATKLVVTSVTGLISIGDTVSGTGITAGTTITAQDSGTPGGAGTYSLSAANTTSAATVIAFGNVIKTTVTTGLISIGDTVEGGAGFPTGATIATQVSGTPGGAGVYTMSARGTAYVASATGVKTYGDKLSVTAVTSGAVEVGDPVTGTGMPSGAVVSAQVSGTAGGIGVYTLDTRATDYAASTTVTAVGGVAITKWTAQSVASVGELVKISTWS